MKEITEQTEEFIQKLHPETGDVFVVKLKEGEILSTNQIDHLRHALMRHADRLEESFGVCVEFLVLPSCVETLTKTVTKKID